LIQNKETRTDKRHDKAGIIADAEAMQETRRVLRKQNRAAIKASNFIKKK
jgi:hypothetical protein